MLNLVYDAHNLITQSRADAIEILRISKTLTNVQQSAVVSHEAIIQIARLSQFCIDRCDILLDELQLHANDPQG